MFRAVIIAATLAAPAFADVQTIPDATAKIEGQIVRESARLLMRNNTLVVMPESGGVFGARLAAERDIARSLGKCSDASSNCTATIDAEIYVDGADIGLIVFGINNFIAD